jgi:hypothetical protein
LRAAVPSQIIALIAAVAIGGTVAGFLAATPLLFVTSPVVAAGLALAAAFGSRGARTLAQLPDGQARDLLADLLRRAETAPAAPQLDPLVSAACEAAQQIHILGAHLDVERCRRGRDLLVQRMQEASAALSRWQAARNNGERLGALARELSDESRFQQEAAREVESLLA